MEKNDSSHYYATRRLSAIPPITKDSGLSVSKGSKLYVYSVRTIRLNVSDQGRDPLVRGSPKWPIIPRILGLIPSAILNNYDTLKQ